MTLCLWMMLLLFSPLAFPKYGNAICHISIRLSTRKPWHLLWKPFSVLFFSLLMPSSAAYKTVHAPAWAALSCHIRIEVNRQASAAVTHTTDESFAAVEVRVAQSIPTQPYSPLYQHCQQWGLPYYHSFQHYLHPLLTPSPCASLAEV